MIKAGDTVDDHIVCLKALVGSHNYNLNTPASDKDYKYFVYPTFDDLYENKMYHKEVVTDTEDYTIHDIRQLPDLLWKANLNFVEILFSKELEGLDGIDCYLYDNQDELALMNSHKLYASCRGMSKQKQRLMLKDSPARRASIEEYGYDTKSACHAARVLHFLWRLTLNGFDVGAALWYEDDSKMQKYLLSIKNGEWRLNAVGSAIKVLENAAESHKQSFENRMENHNAHQELQEYIKRAVKLNLKNHKS